MKIRTDFVTNSSSSSFVTYRITPGKNKEAFTQLQILLNRLTRKYEQRYIANTYGDGEGLVVYEDDDPEINLTMWTPGVSDNYLDDDYMDSDECDNDDQEEHEMEYQEFARWDDSYPPDVAVAFAVLFGDRGDDRSYLSKLDCETELLQDDGQLSESIVTDLTYKEAGRLAELLDKVSVEKIESIGGTD